MKYISSKTCRLGCILTAVLVTALLAGCANPTVNSSEDLTVTIVVDPNPPQIGPARLLINIADAQAKPVNDLNVDLSLNMSTMTMGSQDGAADGASDGQYVRAVTLHSKGKYTLRLWIRRKGQLLKTLDAEFSVN